MLGLLSCSKSLMSRICLVRNVTNLMALSLPVYMKSMLRNVQNPYRRFSQLSLRKHNHVLDANLKQNVLSQSDRFLKLNCQKLSGVSSSMQIHSFIPPKISKPGEYLETDPEELSRNELTYIFRNIKAEIVSPYPEMKEIADYYFDGKGKAFRPMVVILMARCINAHTDGSLSILPEQRQVAMIAEMIHTGSLLHDDVVDNSDTRRGKPSVNKIWGQRKAVLVGDYILSIATRLLTRIDNKEVTSVLTQVISDIIQGEFLQLGSKEEENERFSHYLLKSFKKTATLFAHSCQAVAILGLGDKKVQDIAFNYGKNLGLAFQLIDDALDFSSNQQTLGKPTAADLRLGLATAPVLFACEKYPELNAMIMRRFSQPGDVEKAFEFVLKSDGLEQTHFLAQKHCQEAVQYIQQLSSSSEQKALIILADKVLTRLK